MYLCRNKFLKHWKYLFLEEISNAVFEVLPYFWKVTFHSRRGRISKWLNTRLLVISDRSFFEEMLLLLCQQLDSLILSERAPFEVANVPWCDSILPPFPSLFISIFLLFPFPSIFIYTFFKMVNHVLNVDHLCKKIQNDHIFHWLDSVTVSLFI